MSARRSITIDLDDYDVGIPDEEAIGDALEYTLDGIRSLRGAAPNIQEALIYLEKAEAALRRATA